MHKLIFEAGIDGELSGYRACELIDLALRLFGSSTGHRKNPVTRTGFFAKFRKFRNQSRSIHIATPMPPPMQSVARPFLASRFSIS